MLECTQPLSMVQKMADCCPQAVCWHAVWTQTWRKHRRLLWYFTLHNSEHEDVDHQRTMKYSRPTSLFWAHEATKTAVCNNGDLHCDRGSESVPVFQSHTLLFTWHLANTVTCSSSSVDSSIPQQITTGLRDTPSNIYFWVSNIYSPASRRYVWKSLFAPSEAVSLKSVGKNAPQKLQSISIKMQNQCANHRSFSKTWLKTVIPREL